MPTTNFSRTTCGILNRKIIDLIPEDERHRAWNIIWHAIADAFRQHGEPLKQPYTYQWATAISNDVLYTLNREDVIRDRATGVEAQKEIIKVLEWTRLCYSP